MNKKKIQIIILNKNNKLLDEFAYKIKISSLKGEIEIYPNHSPIIFLIKNSLINIIKYNNNYFFINKGIFTFNNNIIIIFSNNIIKNYMLEKKNIKKKKKKLEKILKNKFNFKIQEKINKLNKYLFLIKNI